MQIYMAPLEGITGFVFRNAYNKYYGGVDKYFTPFITPHTKKNMDERERRDILPENNEGIRLVPQVLTNQAEELISIGKEFQSMGYKEMNLNLGCPSGTVTAKKKGSGFLDEPRKLDMFFEEYFEKSDMPLSIKTRIGTDDIDEFPEIAAVYEKYPFTEVVIHPRVGKEFYRGTPHVDVFMDTLARSRHSLGYNGDIFSLEDYKRIKDRCPSCEKYMLGRGLLWNPQLAADIRENVEHPLDMARFQAFHDELVAGYAAYLSGDRNVLFRMKELWGYWDELFHEEKKLKKQIRKSTTIEEYRMCVGQIMKGTN